MRLLLKTYVIIIGITTFILQKALIALPQYDIFVNKITLNILQ